MAITYTDLLQPTGRLSASLFPGEDSAAVQSRLSGYLTAAYAHSRIAALDAGDTQDDAARWYSYWRAFDAVTLRLNNDAATVEVEDAGRRQRIKEQLAYFERERDAAEARWEALAPPIMEDEDVSETPPSDLRMPSRSVAAQFRF